MIDLLLFFVSLLLEVVEVTSFFHIVSEGHVGVYYRFGKMLPYTTNPGMHLMSPLIVWPSQILIRPQTDVVRNVECTTNDGLRLNFADIDVGNTLPQGNVLSTISRYGEDYDIYLVRDKIRHQIAVICSNLTADEIFITRFDEVDDALYTFLQEENDRLESGLHIDFVRMSKPTLPPIISQSYERIAAEKTNTKVESEKQARLMKQAETNKTVAIAAAETKKQIAEQDTKIMLQNMKTDEDLERIQNRMKVAKAEAEGEAMKMRLQEEAGGLRTLLSIPGYLQLKQSEYLKGNSKVYYGANLPTDEINIKGPKQN